MDFPAIQFRVSDFEDPLPREGYHDAIVRSARLRTSGRGNRFVQVIYHLPESPAECDRVSDAFVIDGPSERGSAVGRRRLLALCRACGFEPKQDEQFPLGDLIGKSFRVELGHDTYKGRKSVRALSYSAQ